ncbi:VOC family protein [Sphingomonas sp. MG17]|uniref:VOC family protein n=1 Tax=Sphingomonas tagetis TaxID=2949092 RepID=A0A9X2KK02_9SPHN|nr:VOC family protein [Sphingomonas tagetis]MCP3730014.1 VOC family protein [Sphingomonas tagetis]
MSILRELVDDAIVETPERPSVLKPYVMSHGTLEVRNLKKSRKFFEEFLGLEVVVHSPSSFVIRLGLKFFIVAVEVGDALHPAQLLNHWGLDMASKEEVDEAYRKAVELKDEWGIAEIKEPIARHGVYSFYLRDLDSNWWEIQYYPGFIHDDLFDFGDRYELS